MTDRYLAEVLTPAARAAQQRYYGRSLPALAPADDYEAPAPLGDDERAFLEARDSVYLATVGAGGWPYVQHRGGPAGFLKVVGERRVAFADLKGNRQLISTGNLAGSDKVALLAIDQATGGRLKLIGHAQALDAREHPALADAVCPDPALRRRVERVVTIDVVATSWNCPSYITPRFTKGEVQAALDAQRAPLERRIAELEARLGAATRPRARP